MDSELNLHHFLRISIEDHVSAVIEKLHLRQVLQEKFQLKGSVQFENHANTLSTGLQLEEYMRSISIFNPPQRRSSRRTANAQPTPRTESNKPEKVGKSARPRADQFCVYKTPGKATETTQYRVLALIGENKPPTKLPLDLIREGLQDMELDDVVRDCKQRSSQDQSRYLLAAVITQAFSYMVCAGLEYGYICTGEAFIFLQIPDNPTTVHYFLSVPKEDVRGTDQQQLQKTAVGQVLAFTLQALRTPTRSQKWRTQAKNKLKTWPDDMLGTVLNNDEFDPNILSSQSSTSTSTTQPARDTDPRSKKRPHSAMS
jgi:hypothetical protein